MRKKIFLVLVIFLSALTLTKIAEAQQRFVANLSGAQEVPAVASIGTGVCNIVLNAAETQITVNCTYSGVSSPVQSSHIHNNGSVGTNGPVKFNFNFTGGTSGTIGPLNFDVTAQDIADLRAKKWYCNIHTSDFSDGEIRGQAKITTTPYDRDGDGRTDITIFRQSERNFYTLSSINNSYFVENFGQGSNLNFLSSYPSDFDGDGQADPTLLYLDQNTGQAYWDIYRSTNHSYYTIPWGSFQTANIERLVPGDYDGDGKTDVAVFRGATGVWYILQSATNTVRYEQFGLPNDTPQTGDFDGDGKADLCAIRKEGNQQVWWIKRSSDGQVYTDIWGRSSGDSIFFFAQVDVDGDGKQDLMISRAVNQERVFWVKRSSDGQPFVLTWGINTGVTTTSDTALVGDYDGDGKTDFVARRNVNGNYVWYIYQSATGTARVVQFGLTGDQ